MFGLWITPHLHLATEQESTVQNWYLLQNFYDQTVKDGVFALESGYATHLAKLLISRSGKLHKGTFQLEEVASIALNLFYGFLTEGKNFRLALTFPNFLQSMHFKMP